MSLVLTDDAGMRDINRRYLGRDEATDVIAFRLDPIPGEKDGPTGEVIVNVQRALAAGPRSRGWSPSRELALYVAHGCNHLGGATDKSAAARARMRRRELEWLRRARREGWLEELIDEKSAR